MADRGLKVSQPKFDCIFCCISLHNLAFSNRRRKELQKKERKSVISLTSISPLFSLFQRLRDLFSALFDLLFMIETEQRTETELCSGAQDSLPSDIIF